MPWFHQRPNLLSRYGEGREAPPLSRNFSILDGSADYIALDSAYTGDITFDVYPLIDGAGLPAGSPAVTALIWNTITVSVTALTDIGKNGADFFYGSIANISGAGLDIPVALASGIEIGAILVGSPEQVSATKNLMMDWVVDENAWTVGDFITTTSTPANTKITQPFGSIDTDYEYQITATHGYTNIPNKRTLRIGAFFTSVTIAFSEKYGGWDAWQYDYYKPADPGHTDLSVRLDQGNQAGAVTDITVSRTLKTANASQSYTVMLGTGQSLSVGQLENAPFPTDEQFVNNDLRYRMMKNATLTFKAGTVASTYEGFKLQKEGSYTHSHYTAMMRQLDDMSGNSDTFVTIPTGQSNTNLAGIAIGTDSYNTGVAQMDALTNIKSASDTLTYPGFTLVHGESGAGGSGDYATELNLLIADMKAEATTHGDASVFNVVQDQPTTGPYWNVCKEIFDISNTRTDYFLSGPKYYMNWNYPDRADTEKAGLHLNGHGYDLQGEYLAKVWNNLLYGAADWKPLQATSAVGSGTQITVYFDVPAPPLVLDTSLVPAAYGNGFNYEGDFGNIEPTIVSVNSDNIVFDVGQTAVDGRVIEIGRFLTAGPVTGWQLPITNIRDSDTTVGATTGETLYNWLVVGDITVSVA